MSKFSTTNVIAKLIYVHPKDGKCEIRFEKEGQLYTSVCMYKAIKGSEKKVPEWSNLVDKEVVITTNTTNVNWKPNQFFCDIQEATKDTLSTTKEVQLPRFKSLEMPEASERSSLPETEDTLLSIVMIGHTKVISYRLGGEIKETRNSDGYVPYMEVKVGDQPYINSNGNLRFKGI